MPYLKEEKNKLRKIYSERRKSLDRECHEAKSKKMCDRIAQTASYRYSDTLLLYYPVKDEWNILHLAKKALSDGKKIAFPRCRASDRTMEFHFVEDISELAVSTFGIPEPSPEAPCFDKTTAKSTLCIVPALVYDREGYRLGYGGGYYDRYLHGTSIICLGAVASDFIIDRVPRSRYDTHVDAIVTEKGVMPFGN